MSRKKTGQWKDDPEYKQWTLPFRSITSSILLQDEAEDEHPPVFYAYLEEIENTSLKLTRANSVSEAKLKAMKGFRNRLAKAVEELDQLIMEFPVQETMDS